MNRENKILILILAAIFAVSLIHSFYFKIQPSVDARAYNSIAVNLFEGRGYREDANTPIEKDFSIARVGPGYELFLAGVYKIFGHHYEIIWFFQALFQALTAFFVFLISREILKENWQPKIGFASAILAGFSPDLIVASSMLLTENLAIFLMLLMVYFFLKYIDKSRWLEMILFAVFFAFSVMARSQFALFLLVLLPIFFIKKDWLKMIVFAFIIILLFLPWTLRNYNIYHTFVPFNAALGLNLWNGNHLGATGEMEIDYQPMINYAKDHSPIEIHRKGTEEFKKFVIQHPLEFIKITLKRISIFFSFSRPTGFWPSFTKIQQAITAFFSSIYSVIIFTLGISGMAMAIKKFQREDKKRILYLISLSIFIPLSVIFIVVETRYRYPIYPLLAIFGGIVVSEIISDKRNIRFLIIPFLILTANSLLDFALNFNKFWGKIRILF